MRNIQLSILAIPLGVMVCATKHGSAISENGFFHGYDAFVAYLVALNATGGLLVAVVVKYADNILKVNFNGQLFLQSVTNSELSHQML